jgi:hypothetical protein
MPQFGGKDSKRHFTVVMEGKEHGLYVSSTPSSAAKKAVTKLCAANKSKKVEFHIREITQGSKKKTYGPYSGHIEKLKEPIELKGRVIKYKPVAKLSGKSGAKKGGMKGYSKMARWEIGKSGKIIVRALNNLDQEFYGLFVELNGKFYIIKLYEDPSRMIETSKNFYLYDETANKYLYTLYDLAKYSSIYSGVIKKLLNDNHTIIIRKGDEYYYTEELNEAYLADMSEWENITNNSNKKSWINA